MKKSLFNFYLMAQGLSSCITYGEATQSQFASLNSTPCLDRSENVFLFFEEEDINFEYEKVGLLEVDGGRYARLQELLDELKYKAWSNCANAVLFVKQSTTVRESGTTFSDEQEELYSTTRLSGLAVKLNGEALQELQNLQGLNKDNFVSRVEDRKQKEQRQTGAEVAGGIIGVILGIVLLITIYSGV
ncbi:MAG: hypothetical protein AAF616_11395 [Bacteroidota bacterium]